MKTMPSSGIQRRRLLQGLGLLAVTPTQVLATASGLATPPLHRQVWLSAQGSTTNAYGMSWVSQNEQNIHNAHTGFRGHGVTLHPGKADTALMFARRPGMQAIEVNIRSGQMQQAFHCEANHHLFGHGCFSPDGKALFTTEGDIPSGKGKIVIRDGLTYQKLDEYDSHGIGPHEIKVMPDGKTLVVANGGILTRPDSGRRKLNLDSMASSLDYLKITNGELLERARPDDDKASIRHIDVAADGTVAMAIQVQREAMTNNQLVPLSALHQRGQTIQSLPTPHALLAQMNDYMGSVTINNRSRIAGFTSPKGNVASFWHLDNKALIGYHRLHDVCGLAVTPDQQYFALTNSQGEMRLLDAYNLQEVREQRQQRQASWDNHLLITEL